MYNGERMTVIRPPPWLSQHTTEVCSLTCCKFYELRIIFKVLQDLGYDDEQILRLQKKEVI